jgi:magnesium transporter
LQFGYRCDLRHRDAAQRESLAVARQANMAVISLQQNEIVVRQNSTMKQLTIIATISLPLSFITGFFGMNFGWMVGHITSLWVFVVFGLGSLAASGIGLLAWSRETGMTSSADATYRKDR